MLKRLSFLIMLLFAGLSQAQHTKYFIQFTDKLNSPYNIGTPSDFLSQKAIDRRTRQHIAVIDNDIPVNPNYVAAVENTGAVIFAKSKWMNGVVVQCDSTQLQNILTLSFVRNAKMVNRQANSVGGKNKFKTSNTAPLAAGNLLRIQSYDYGSSFNQIHLMN
ncbi:MAG TPA: hypothetical protein PKK99_15310, partial [Bacteroidia bacterium]|nr:hypothetical protein [Bacteroidia bacterium]